MRLRKKVTWLVNAVGGLSALALMTCTYQIEKMPDDVDNTVARGWYTFGVIVGVLGVAGATVFRKGIINKIVQRWGRPTDVWQRLPNNEEEMKVQGDEVEAKRNADP